MDFKDYPDSALQRTAVDYQARIDRLYATHGAALANAAVPAGAPTGDPGSVAFPGGQPGQPAGEDPRQQHVQQIEDAITALHGLLDKVKSEAKTRKLDLTGPVA